MILNKYNKMKFTAISYYSILKHYILEMCDLDSPQSKRTEYEEQNGN